VILTFDPIGGYHHPDHIHIHDATVKAFDLANDPNFQDGLPTYQPARLYFHTISKRFIRTGVRLIKMMGKDPSKWGKNEDIDLTSLAVEDYPVHARIKYPKVEDRKAAASACHASQGGGRLVSGPLAWLMRLFGGSAVDTFMQAFPQPDDGSVLEDLFEGIN